MKEKKNIFLLIFAIVFFIIAVAFFMWSFFGEHKTNLVIDDIVGNQASEPKYIASNEIDKENSINNETDNQEINNIEDAEVSKTEDVENVSYTDITIYNEKDEEIALSDFSNNSVVMLFWNPENEESIEVLKKVNSLCDKYKDKIKFLMVSTLKDIPEDIKNEINLEIYYDLNNQYQEKYNIQKIPTIIYIYKDNSIMNAKSGVPSTDAIEANLDLLSDNF